MMISLAEWHILHAPWHMHTVSYFVMMTSSNGSIFRVTGPSWGESTAHWWFPSQKPVTRIFDVFFDRRLNKRLSKQSRRWWFETPSRSLWRHCHVFCWGQGNGRFHPYINGLVQKRRNPIAHALELRLALTHWYLPVLLQWHFLIPVKQQWRKQLCRKTCIVGLLIRSILRGENWTSASVRVQFF